MTEEEFAARSILIGSVSYEEIKKAGDNLTYTDTLELAGVPARLRYAVRYVNAAGQSAAFSNFFLMEPAAKVAEPPTVIKAGNEYSFSRYRSEMKRLYELLEKRLGQVPYLAPSEQPDGQCVPNLALHVGHAPQP